MGGLVLPSALAGVALGILAGDAGWMGGGPAPSLLLGALVMVAGAALRRPAALSAGVLLVAAAAGSWRGADATLPTGPGSVAALTGTVEWRIQGTVTEDARPRGERQQVVLDDVVVAGGDGGTARAPGRVLVWLPRAVAVTAGDRIAFASTLDEPRDFDGFAYRAYLARQGIGAVASAFRVDVLGHRLGAIPDALGALRRALLTGLNSLVPEPEAALGAGILLGVRSGIAPEVSDAFATAGLTHVVAISGWNIAIVATLAAAATRPLLRLPGGRWLGLAVAGAAVAGYVLLTGASPSVVRAALMAGALVLARVEGSRAHAISALMLAALLMLVAAPPVLWDVGFQLSALATAGLVWFGAPMEARLRRWPAMVREPVALTLAAQLTTLPVILLNFERLSLVAPLANVVVVPLVPIVMLCSALVAVSGMLDAAFHVPLLSDLVTWATGGATWLYLRLMILAGQAAAAVPFASFDLGAPAWLAVAWYPALALMRNRIGPSDAGNEPAELPSVAAAALRPRSLMAATVMTLAILTIATRPDGRLHLVMLDIGQGDAILVRAPSGATALIDGGPDPDLAMRRLGEELPFWQRDLALVILTHPHEDHVAGLLPALQRFRVATILDPGRPYDNPTYPRFVDAARHEPHATYRPARAGDRYALDAVTGLTILFPSEADANAPLLQDDINNTSVVALLTGGEFDALLTGDAEAPVEAFLQQRQLIGPVDVLKVAHHGSESGTTPAFLAALRPRVALISAGAGNEYGHPHAVTLEHLAAIPGLVVHRTDREGTVELVAEGGRAEVHDRRKSVAGSIGPWPSRPASGQRRSSRRSTCRTASSATRGEWRGSRSRPRGWWRRAASRSTPRSSRSPPCCTTSTSWRRTAGLVPTGSWPPNV